MNIKIIDQSDIFNYFDFLTLEPKEYPQVSVYDKQLKEYKLKTVYRKYLSYGISPEFKNTSKSYMFNNKSSNMPEIIQKMLNWAKTYDSRYNNVYVNWYGVDDYIEPHSDCIDSLVPNSSIMILNLNEGVFTRTFFIEHKENRNDFLNIPLIHGRIIIMSAEEQINYRHSVDIGLQGRISITFRAVKS